jgi:hypothetical protein
MQQVNSLIIRLEDKDVGSHLQLLRVSFGCSVRLELMFRASDHGFSAKAFHAKCDNIEDTLTLVRTEFGRTIAGYTNYKWNAVRGYVRDEGRRAFLLSFDHAEKYVPQQEKNLIYCQSGNGPIFGRYDLVIADGCNTNSDSYACFPYSYNREGQQQNRPKPAELDRLLRRH